MELLTTVHAMRCLTDAWRREGLLIGLVPTMGYLHAGHASLIERAAAECDRVAVSIFVNPTQFAANEDLDAYPRDFERDSVLCASLGVDGIFVPPPGGMYPHGFSTYVEVQSLTENLCGKSRPTHFRGVCTVVSKLLNIARPHKAYFGQKDAQQLRVIARMALDLDMGIDIVPCPIVREADGLAMSSRNAYLNPEERQAALVLHKALAEARAMLEQGARNTSVLVRRMTNMITAEPLARIDYVEIVDDVSLARIDCVEHPVLVALAVHIGKTRLIDNITFTP